jgi:hypothetical protein
MGSQDELVGTGEQTLKILRKEGEMAKPNDTRCQAKVGNGRCKNEIILNAESGDWLIWCQAHEDQENEARVEGGERVQRFESEDDESEDESEDDE